MSPLTKLFVVLLVLVSVALSAGTITFVNRLDPLQRNLANTQADLASKTALLTQKNNETQESLARITEVTNQAAAEKAAGASQQLAIRSQMEEKDAQIARLNNTIAGLTGANSSQSTALSASEDAKGKLNEQVTMLRKDADDRLRQNSDQGQRINTLVAQLEQTERARRNLAEQLTDANQKVGQFSKLMQDKGITTAELDRAGTGAGAPALNGIIRSRRNIAGKEYATISLGSQDYVTKGMQFKIIDKDTGNFLGFLNVEVVDQNEAIGQITAEQQNLAQIKAGNVVRTQI